MTISDEEVRSRAYSFAARVIQALDAPTVRSVQDRMLRQEVLFVPNEINQGVSFEDGMKVADLTFEPSFIEEVMRSLGIGAAAVPS